MYYIPYGDAVFDEWLENFSSRLPAIATFLGVPVEMVSAVTLCPLCSRLRFP